MNLFHESKKVLDKDGKVNPLGPYGKQKLTGREVSTYFRRNKVKDPQIKKAVEVALDLQGAMSVASSEIKKFYGDKILKSKEVQSALKYANESVEYDIREDLNEFRRYIVKGPRGEVKVTANSESDAITRARSGHMANTPRSAFSARMEGSFWGQDKMAKKAASHFSKNTHVRLVKDKGGYSRATISKKDKEKIAQLKKDGYKEVPLDENYRKLAQYGMGTETSKSARVGLEHDFYDSKGNKQFGKIIQKTNTGYLVKDDKGKKHVLKYHDRKKAAKMLKPNYVHTEKNEFSKNPLKGFPYNEELQKNIQEEVRSVLGEAPYDKADVKKVKVLEKKLKNMLKEVDKTMRGSGLSAPAFADIRSGISKGLKSIEKFYRVAKQIPMKPTKPGQQPQASISDILKMGESINEVTDKEINMAKKLSKDMEKVKKGYQQIAKTGDKTLKSTGFNPTYEAILKAQQKVLSLIGELNTMKMMSDRAASRQKDSKGRPIMNSFDAYRDMQNAEHCELVEGKVLKFTKVKDKSLEKHLKVVTKKVGAKLEKISGGFAVSDTDMRGFTAVVDYIFDKSIKKNMLDGGGMSDVTMANESVLSEAKMSKEMPLDVYAKKLAIDKKEEEWIMKNEKAGGMYYNNSMFPSAYTVLSYPIYDKDYYFAFIGDSMRENAKANAEMNRTLRSFKKLKATPEQKEKGFDDKDALFAKMYERFGRLERLGAHDTMTREELSYAVTHIKTGRATNEMAYEYDLMKAVDGGTFFEEVSDKKQETFTEGKHGQMLRNIQMKALRRKSKIKGRAGAFESMSYDKLNVMDEYAQMYEDAVQKAREKQRLSDTHRREKEALAKKHARMPNK